LNESRRALYYLATPPALFDPFVDQVDTAEPREGTVVVVDSRRCLPVIDLNGAWLGGNASLRVMNLAIRREN
jgi:hypothetical protein